jgi:hypothetical protein
VFVAGQLGQRLQEAVGGHREERQLVRRPPAARPRVAPQDLPDPELFPQGPRDVDAPERAGPLERDRLLGPEEEEEGTERSRTAS